MKKILRPTNVPTCKFLFYFLSRSFIHLLLAPRSCSVITAQGASWGLPASPLSRKAKGCSSGFQAQNRPLPPPPVSGRVRVLGRCPAAPQAHRGTGHCLAMGQSCPSPASGVLPSALPCCSASFLSSLPAHPCCISQQSIHCTSLLPIWP